MPRSERHSHSAKSTHDWRLSPVQKPNKSVSVSAISRAASGPSPCFPGSTIHTILVLYQRLCVGQEPSVVHHLAVFARQDLLSPAALVHEVLEGAVPRPVEGTTHVSIARSLVECVHGLENVQAHVSERMQLPLLLPIALPDV